MTTRALDEKDKYTVTGSALGAVGSAAVAIFASLCCAGPAVVAVLGAGGAVAAAGLVPYRPYFLAASFALLGIGFWRSYWPHRSPSGAACSVSMGRRVRAALWVSLAVTLVAAVLSFFVP
jgi:mercuric ion transport protein